MLSVKRKYKKSMGTYIQVRKNRFSWMESTNLLKSKKLLCLLNKKNKNKCEITFLTSIDIFLCCYKTWGSTLMPFKQQSL